MFYYLLFCLPTNFESLYYYVSALLIFGVSILKTIATQNQSSVFVRLKFVDLLVVSLLLVWFYGLVVGFYRGNNKEFVINNFAGMTMYVIYFLLIPYSKQHFKMEKMLIKAALIAAFVTVLFYVAYYIIGVDWTFVLDNPIFGNFKLTGSSTGQKRVFYAGQLVIFVLYASSLTQLIQPKIDSMSAISIVNGQTKTTNLLLLGLSVISLFFFTASKGYLLGGMFLFVFIPILLFWRGGGDSGKKSKYMSSMLLYAAIGVVTILIFILTGYGNIAEVIFDKNDVANLDRYEQLGYLLNDLKFFGNGLGAEIMNFTRSDDKPYGFELVYFNIIHKFGVFALLIIFSYFYTIYKCAKMFFNPLIDKRIAAAALGCMGYLFPSFGNPLLFSPQSVILHCVALYFIRIYEPYINLGFIKHTKATA